MKNLKSYVTLILTSILIIAPFFIIKAQDTTVKNVLYDKSYNHMIGWDIFSVNYSYSIINRKSWSAGITAGVGMGFNIGIIRPNLKVTYGDCDDWSIRKMDLTNIELARIGAFVRLNYFKNNYLEFSPYISAFGITGYTETFLTKPGLAMGGGISNFFWS